MSNKDLPRKVDISVDAEQRVSDDFFGCKFEVKIIDKDRKPVPWHPFKLKQGEEVVIDGETNGEGIFEGEKVLNIRRYTQSKVTLILEDNPATAFVNIPTNLEREPQPDKENGPIKGIHEIKWPEEPAKPVFNIDDIFTSSGKPNESRSAFQKEIIIEIRKLGIDPIKLHKDGLEFFEWMNMPQILGEVSFDPNLETSYKTDFGIPMDKDLLQKLVDDFSIARKSSGTRPDVEIQDQRLLNYGGLSLFFTKLFREGDVILEVADSDYLEEILLYANPIEIATGTFDLEKLFTKDTAFPSLVEKTEKIIKKNRKEYKGKIEIKVMPKPILKDGHVVWDMFERNHPEFMPDLPTFLLYLNRLQDRLNSGKLNLTDTVQYTVYLNAFTEECKVVLANVKIDQNKVRVSLKLDTIENLIHSSSPIKKEVEKRDQSEIDKKTKREELIRSEEKFIKSYKANYNKWDSPTKSRCSWEEVLERLLNNDGHYLKLAKQMNEGGILFGLDLNGNPMVADGGSPVNYKLDYITTIKLLISEGYGLFPSDMRDGFEMSHEIIVFEQFTNKTFLCKDECSWLDYGDTVYGDSVVCGQGIKPFYIRYEPSQFARNDFIWVKARIPKGTLIGVRRLLILKK